MKKHRAKGYTFVEMMVVLGIMGSITLYTVTGQITHYRYAAFVEQAVEMIQAAQQSATQRNVITQVMVTQIGDETYFVRKTNGDTIEEKLPISKQMAVTFSNDEQVLTFKQDMSPTKACTVCIQYPGIGEATHITVRVGTGKVAVYHHVTC